MAAKSNPDLPPKQSLGPFRRAVLRGLGVLLPPLLTIAIFLWVGNTLITYCLEPLEAATRSAFVWSADWSGNIRKQGTIDVNTLQVVDGKAGVVEIEGQRFHETDDGYYIDEYVYSEVARQVPRNKMPAAAMDIYRQYVDLTYLRRELVIPIFFCVFVLLLYVLGRFFAAGMGRIMWAQFEQLILRIPLVSKVYTSVKQVTDFMFSEPQLEATRVVAIEYPRKGIWTLAMVTGESMLDIRAAANEPVLSVLVPTSPMPFTGFTMTVRKSETVDLNITIDQALQFIVSCGVVVPPQQMAAALENRSSGGAALPSSVPKLGDA